MNDENNTPYDLSIQVIKTTVKNILTELPRHERELMLQKIHEEITFEAAMVNALDTNPFMIYVGDVDDDTLDKFKRLRGVCDALMTNAVMIDDITLKARDFHESVDWMRSIDDEAAPHGANPHHAHILKKERSKKGQKYWDKKGK